jgi:hypothetical protein
MAESQWEKSFVICFSTNWLFDLKQDMCRPASPGKPRRKSKTPVDFLFEYRPFRPTGFICME